MNPQRMDNRNKPDKQAFTTSYVPKRKKKDYVKVRYMGEKTIVYYGKVSGHNYGIRNPRTRFHILKEDAEHPESLVDIIK